MTKFPNFTQYDSMDCGPTCLKMISLHYGKDVSIVYLRNLCCATNRGVTLYGLDRAARELGFNTLCSRVSLEQLRSIVPLPCIIHWNNEHFVVLYKVCERLGRNIFYVSDPIGSRFSYNEQEFTKCWGKNEQRGVVLCLEPTSCFFESKFDCVTPAGLKIFFKYIKTYIGSVAQVLIGLILSALLLLTFPFFTQAIVDHGITNKNVGFIWTILIAQLCLILGNTAIGFIRSWLLLHIGMRINLTIISDFIIKLTKLPMGFFDSRMIGDILQRIGDNSRIKDFVTETFLSIILSMLTIIVLGGVVLFYNFWVFVIFFLGSLLHMAWIMLFMKKRAALDKKMFAQTASSQTNLIQLVMGMQEIKLCGCENQKRWDWEDVQAKIYSLAINTLSLFQYQQSGAIFISQCKNAIITALIASFTIKGDMTLGMMMSVQFIIGQLNNPIEQLIRFFRKYQDAKLSLERLNDIQTIKNEKPDNNNLIKDIPKSSLSLKNVSFKYDKLSSNYIINNISLDVPLGKTTAVVGLSGSGKTTLMKLILGFYEPDEGGIYIGGNNLLQYDISEWRKSCGVVMQDGYIFSDTIAANIAPSVDVYDQERLIDCARIACILDFIESLPLGFNTVIGSDGQGLSMGQKQRILIARAIYKNPSYVLLDEATNSLDAENEAKIMDGVRVFLKGKTSLIIAHRLSTIQHADNIVVMNDGMIIEQGTHAELLAAHGKYFELISKQLSL